MKEVLVFGDSTSRIFTLIDVAKVVVFKGKSITGIIKKEDKDSKKMLQIIKDHRQIKCVLFWFCLVDIHFVFFYKLINKEIFIDFDKLIHDYVIFINSIKTKSKKVIIAPIPPPWKDVVNGLKNYGEYQKLDQEKLTDDVLKEYFNKETLTSNYEMVMNSLIKYTKKYKIDLVDIEGEVSTPSGRIKKEFQCPNENSIHVRWEPLITKIVNKFNKCNIFYKNIKIDRKKEKVWLKKKKDMLDMLKK